MAKNTQHTKVTRHSDIRVSSYTYKGIEIWVQIDYIAKKISLINALQPQHGVTRVDAKKWVFAERELEYMAGWHDILDAMKYAVSRSSEELKEYLTTTKK